MFKVGDWVIQTDGDDLGDKPIQIKFEDDTMISFDGETFWSDSVFSKWQPKDGEWCWVFDDELRSELTNKAYITSDGVIKTHDSCKWEYCEPFIGELPSFLKD